MSHRTVSWNRISRSLHDSRPAIPAGMLGARALIQLGARTRPLVVAGRYDRAAIMAAACKAATGIQDALRRLPRRGDVLRSQGHLAGRQGCSPRGRSLTP